MAIHKEGFKIIFIALLLLVLINYCVYNFLASIEFLPRLVLAISIVVFAFVVQFFRNPDRNIIANEKYLLAPADGKVVVIEETTENEYFQDKRMQVSIFMSPLNVHVNRNPADGTVRYFKYHPGKYLVAWHPKSSTENERTTLVIAMKNNVEILLRQIAGAMAKRIIWYVKQGETVEQGEEFGFITFGSRVDVFLPLDTKIRVKIGDKTVGGKTVLAEID
jgi:phosphatidylserine decarboxylase